MTLRWVVFDSQNRTIARVRDPESVPALIQPGSHVRYGRLIVWRDDLVTPIDVAAMVRRAVENSERQPRPPHRSTLYRRAKRLLA